MDKGGAKAERGYHGPTRGCITNGVNSTAVLLIPSCYISHSYTQAAALFDRYLEECNIRPPD